jgi:hypothetical protein
MVKISLEKGWGRWNKDYITMLVRPEEGDNHYRAGSYMPKHSELYEMIEKLLSCEPPSKRAILTAGFLDAIQKGNATAELNPDKTNKPKSAPIENKILISNVERTLVA